MGGAEGDAVLDIFSLCWSVGTLWVIFVFIFVTCSMLFFVSGKRFNYTFYDKSCGKIWQSIETLDKAVCIHLISLWMQNKATVISLWTIIMNNLGEKTPSHTYLSTQPPLSGWQECGFEMACPSQPPKNKTHGGKQPHSKQFHKCDTGPVE